MNYLNQLHEYIKNETVCGILGIELPESTKYYDEIGRYELPQPLTFLSGSGVSGLHKDDIVEFLGKTLQTDRVEWLRNRLKTHTWEPYDIGIQEYTNGAGQIQLTWRSIEKFEKK